MKVELFIVRECESMLQFKNMRQRVEFAYEHMNVDIYYEGDYRYTLENRITKKTYEMLSEDQVDKRLNKMWKRL